jgi:putative redox protein
MEMRVRFPGGWRVDADCGGHTIQTDHPIDEGGDDSAPTPVELFVAALSTCAGMCALSFMRHRGLDAGSAKLIVHTDLDPASELISSIHFELALPSGFPEKYRTAIVKAMQNCAVKQHLSNPPSFQITTVMP